jgi:hypothetical protein
VAPVADHRALATGIPNDSSQVLTGNSGLQHSFDRRPNDDSLNEKSVSRAAHGRSTAGTRLFQAMPG